MTITSLSLHYRAIPHSLPQSHSQGSLLPLHIHHVAFPTVAENPNLPVSPYATLSFSSHQSQYAFLYPPTSTSHQCTTEPLRIPHLLILLHLFVYFLPGKAITEGTNILKMVVLMGRAEREDTLMQSGTESCH